MGAHVQESDRKEDSGAHTTNNLKMMIILTSSYLH